MGGTEGGGGGVRINVGGSEDRRPSSGSLSILEGFFRKRFSSYKKLPREPIKLSVLKLDGSCFDIKVMRTATVLELKEAVESVFDDMPISWKHLWGRFCLSYCGQKLIVETECITDYGIKAGDETYAQKEL